MAQIIHNISSPNDDLGDKLRTAFDHQNEMNTELYTDKVDKVTGKDLSTNDFTDEEQTKLAGIETGAEVNIQSDWSQSDNTQDDYIKNKPVLNNYVNTIGYFDYNNSSTTPLTLVANTEKKLTNDTVGDYTDVSNPTHGVTRLFDPSTNNIVLDELQVGDLVKLRVDVAVTTGTANQFFRCVLRLGLGTTKQFEVTIHEEQIKDTGSHQRTFYTGFYVGSEEVRVSLGELILFSDHSGSVVINGFFFEAIKRNVNFVELSGGTTSTPTLQEVTDVGASTTNEVTITDIANENQTIIGRGFVSIIKNAYVNVLYLFGDYINFTTNRNNNLKGSDGASDITLNFPNKSGTFDIATFDDITADNADALKRDGSNANADVDLASSGYSVKAKLVTIGSPSTQMEVHAEILSTNRTAQWQDKDYIGIADITDIPDVSGFITDAPNDANSYVRSGLGWVIGYTKSAIDTLLGNKVDKVTGKSLIADTEITRVGTMATNANVGVVPNSSITGNTKTKITYDSKGLVTSGADATTTDIAEGTNLYYTEGRVNINPSVVANTAKVTNATHTGDATGSTVLTLATVNSNVGTVGSSSKTVTVTTNAKGLTTAISEQDIQITESQVTGLTSDLAGKQPLLSYTPYKFIQTSQTTILGSVVGTTETIIATATIPGGTFNANDIMRVIHKITKSGGVVSILKLKINTSNTLSGATQIATFSTTTTYTYAKMVRTFDLQGGNLYGYGFTIGVISDDIANNTTPSSATYNTANTLYLFWTITLGSSADSIVPNLCSLTN